MNLFKLARVIGIVCTTTFAVAGASLANMAYENGRIGPSMVMAFGAAWMFAAATTMLVELCQ